jgi:hypothetical protein
LPYLATGHLRLRLSLLFILVAGMLSVLAYPYGSLFYLSPFLLRFSTFSFLPLAALDWLYGSSGRIPTRKLLLLFFAGIAATVGSALYSTVLVRRGPALQESVEPASLYLGSLTSTHHTWDHCAPFLAPTPTWARPHSSRFSST